MVSVPDGGHQNADELAGGGDGGVGESTKPADGEEDEVLANSSTKTEQQNVPRSSWMLLQELHRFPASSAWPSEHEEGHVDGAPQVHAHHDMPRVCLRILLCD